jgi:mannosyltransferase
MSTPRVKMADIEVIVPNFKRRLSGVTSTIIQLVPLQAKTIGIATLGPGLPDHLPKMRWWQLPALWRRPMTGKPRIWHARRNTEMLGGVILRDVLRMPLKLVFTSAAQRHHTHYTQWLIRRMDRVIATSARSGSYLAVSHDVIPHGIDLDGFAPPEDRPSTRELLVGCFGRVREQKGTDLFVDAMIALLPNYPDGSAVICGRVTADHRAFADDLEQRIEAARLSDRIRFLGEVDDIKPWYQKVSLYVAPSRNEGFGLTPLEAMASGTPVVATDAGAYAEMIVPGMTGAVVPAGDGAALRSAIEGYLRSPATAMAHGMAGREQVVARFGLAREQESVGRVYESLLCGAA